MNVVPRIAVIGAGFAGRQFALACTQAGFHVVLEDVMPAKLRHAEAEFTTLGLGVELALTVEDAVREAAIVVDFVPDELESKLEIFSLLDRMSPPRTVMCTPSESLSITDLASCTYRPDRCIMIRGDLAISGPLRLLTAAETSNATTEFTAHILSRLGHAVTVEHDPDLPMLLKNMHAAQL
jgi:3-hydroxybutyryl-CoA dehydrogenase